MFIFGHAGLTLGAAILIAGAFAKNYGPTARKKESTEVLQAPPGLSDSQNSPSMGPVAWFASLAGRIDIRILLTGSLLPDIIDKPIGRLFFREIFSNGRIFSHTLLFLIIITVGGLILYRTRSKTWLLVLAFGTFTHLILDGMWTSPHTLLWPLYGFSFGKYPVSVWSWIAGVLNHVSTHPWVLIPEIAGMIIITWFGWQLARRKKLLAFLKYGQT
jgi:inner membrane protein